jgi:hypothetical protein
MKPSPAEQAGAVMLSKMPHALGDCCLTDFHSDSAQNFVARQAVDAETSARFSRLQKGLTDHVPDAAQSS